MEKQLPSAVRSPQRGEPARESQKRNPNVPWKGRALRTLMARLEVKMRRKEVGIAIVMIAAHLACMRKVMRKNVGFQCWTRGTLTENTLTAWTVLTATAAILALVAVELLVAAPIVPDGLLFSAI